MAGYAGSCACGAIQYEFTAEPVASGHCQCRGCQRATGTGHSSGLLVPKSAFKLTGTPKLYERSADSGGKVSNAFCEKCGTPLYCVSTNMADIVFVRVGSLNDPSRFTPQMVVFAESGHTWDHLDPSLPKFPKSSPMDKN